MEHTKQVPSSQEGVQPSGQMTAVGTKPRYQPPQVIVYGTVIELTKGSGGAYDDECTSGRQPGDDE